MLTRPATVFQARCPAAGPVVRLVRPGGTPASTRRCRRRGRTGRGRGVRRRRLGLRPAQRAAVASRSARARRTGDCWRGRRHPGRPPDGRPARPGAAAEPPSRGATPLSLLGLPVVLWTRASASGGSPSSMGPVGRDRCSVNRADKLDGYAARRSPQIVIDVRVLRRGSLTPIRVRPAHRRGDPPTLTHACPIKTDREARRSDRGVAPREGGSAAGPRSARTAVRCRLDVARPRQQSPVRRGRRVTGWPTAAR